MQIRKIAAGVLAFVFSCSAVTISGIVQQRNSQTITKAANALDYTEATYNQLTYCAFDDHIVISDCDTSAVEITIPEEIGSLPVTQIDDRAFCNCTKLVSITIPETVTVIGSGTFQECTRLESVNIPSGVTEISSSVFEDCASLTEIIIPDGVTNIGYSAFENCSNLAQITIPDSVTEIQGSAFADCSALTQVTIPDNVTTVGYGAFYDCSSLETLAIPANTTYLDYYFCSNCPNLTEITVAEGNERYFSVDGALFKRDYFDESNPEASILVICPAQKTSYSIPDGTIAIGSDAFEGCIFLESVQIPDSVQEIRDGAFQNCQNLSDIVIPDNVTRIGNFAFSGCERLQSLHIPAGTTHLGAYFCADCPSLTAIDVAPENEIYSSTDGVLFKNAYYNTFWEEWEPFKLVVYPEGKQGDYQIPEGVTEINTAAFENCTGLETVIIPESVVNIGWCAFRYCTGLKYATILNGDCDLSYYSWIRLREGGAIYGLENSTAQTYADQVHYEFRLAGAEELLSPGDPNNDGFIDAADAALILEASANVGAGNNSSLTKAQELSADVNHDGLFNAFDSSIILSYAAAAGAGIAESFTDFLEEFLAE